MQFALSITSLQPTDMSITDSGPAALPHPSSLLKYCPLRLKQRGWLGIGVGGEGGGGLGCRQGSQTDPGEAEG